LPPVFNPSKHLTFIRCPN